MAPPERLWMVQKLNGSCAVVIVRCQSDDFGNRMEWYQRCPPGIPAFCEANQLKETALLGFVIPRAAQAEVGVSLTTFGKPKRDDVWRCTNLRVLHEDRFVQRCALVTPPGSGLIDAL